MIPSVLLRAKLSALTSPSPSELEAIPGGRSSDDGCGGLLKYPGHHLQAPLCPYVHCYMHLATRRILLASCTRNPSEIWICQQAQP